MKPNTQRLQKMQSLRVFYQQRLYAEREVPALTDFNTAAAEVSVKRAANSLENHFSRLKGAEPQE